MMIKQQSHELILEVDPGQNTDNLTGILAPGTDVAENQVAFVVSSLHIQVRTGFDIPLLHCRWRTRFQKEDLNSPSERKHVSKRLTKKQITDTATLTIGLVTTRVYSGVLRQNGVSSQHDVVQKVTVTFYGPDLGLDTFGSDERTANAKADFISCRCHQLCSWHGYGTTARHFFK